MTTKTDQSQSLLNLETYTVTGSPSEMGRAYGKKFKSKILSFIDMRLNSAERYFQDWERGSVDELLARGADCWAQALKFDPEAAREQEALAEAIGISPERLYATTNMTDVRDVVLLPDVQPPAEDEGCTSVLIPPSSTNVGLYGQSWDLNPPDINYVFALHRLPDHGVETWTVTCTGCMTLVGMNEHGISVGTTNLKTWKSRVGVGYLSVLHKAVRQPTFEKASQVCQLAPVAGAHSYWIAHKEGAIEWERSPDEAFKRDTLKGPIGRANHCLFEPHQQREWVKPTPSSATRYKSVNELINKPEHQSLEGLIQVFSDRSEGIYSINRYIEDGQGTITNAVVISDPVNKTLNACRGSADRGQWTKLTFDRQS